MSEKHPFDLLDLGLLLFVAPLHPLALGAVLAQWFVRRSPAIVGSAAELMQSVGVPALPVSGRARGALQALLPAAAQLPGPAAQPSPILAGATALPRLTLAEIAQDDNILVVGPKNSGKTTTLLRLIALRRGGHIALDPHATPGKWPGCTAVGGGLEWDEIAAAMRAGHTTMRNRYKAQAQGKVTEAQCKARRLTLVGDEWRAIARGVADGPDTLLDLLAQGRKAGVCMLAAAHNDTATTMGIVGEKDLLDCFDWVIYLGAKAIKKAPEAARMARPAVAYHPERGELRLLDVDAVGVAVPRAVRDLDRDAGTLAGLLGADLSQVPADRVTGTPAVPAHWDAVPGVVPGTGSRIGGTGSPDDAGTGFDRDLADALIAAGWSANRIYAKVGGKRAAVLAYVRERRGGAENLDEPGGDVPPAFRLIK